MPSAAAGSVKPSYRAVASSGGVGTARDRDRRDDRRTGYASATSRDRDRDTFRDRHSRFGDRRDLGRDRRDERDRDRDRDRESHRERSERPEGKTRSGSRSRSASPEGRVQLHPLESDWTIWFDCSKRGQLKGGGLKGWESKLKEVGHFNNVEYFWRYYHHLEKPSNLEPSANYHFFRTGIKPMWEDEANKGGGKWTLRIQPKDKHHLDALWLNLILAMIGEVFDRSEDICGAVLSRRKNGDRISVWNSDRTNEEAILRLGRQIKEVLADGIESPPDLTLQYSYHEDSIKLGSGYATLPAQYTV